MSLANFGQRDLEQLEAAVVSAARRRDHGDLNAIGFGEISLALGYPASEPEVVCKRVAVCTEAQYLRYAAAVESYVDQLAAAGLSVAPTRPMAVGSADRTVAYVVQPLLASSSIGDRVLRAAEPTEGHPLLAAIADALGVVSNRMSIDAQVTNWSWDGTTATLIDVGTPFLWGADGALAFDVDPIGKLFPAPVRRAVVKELDKLASRWREPRAVAVDIVANLLREDLDRWVEPAMVTFNDRIEGEPITRAEATAMYHEDRKTMPLLKRLQRIERAWQTRMRRRPYDFIITETTY